MNDDRVKSQDSNKKLPKPEVSIVKNGKSVFKPGMKTYFVETKSSKSDTSSSGKLYTGEMKTVTETVCVCNKVCTCNPQCSCESHCSCDARCSCESNCTCDSQCSCESNSGSGSYCSCNKVCSCVPVH